MPRSSFELIHEFHEKLGLVIGADPYRDPDRDQVLRRVTLLAEETAELFAALIGWDQKTAKKCQETLVKIFRQWEQTQYEDSKGHYKINMADVAKEAIDVHVVTSGICVEFGIPEDVVFEAVHASNLAKAGGRVRADGKQLKPKGWKKPDVETIVYNDGVKI